MSLPITTLSLLLLLLLILTPPLSAAPRHSHRRSPAASELVRASCVHANYPALCLRTLAAYPAPRTRRDLALAALAASLARARRASAHIAAALASAAPPRRQRPALADCAEQIADTVDELAKALAEIRHLRGETFRWQMSNAETWVSAALTDEDTCLDGFQELAGAAAGDLKDDVRRRITNVARVTSNALYLINRLDESRGKP